VWKSLLDIHASLPLSEAIISYFSRYDQRGATGI
jgi:hypothetical protein